MEQRCPKYTGPPAFQETCTFHLRACAFFHLGAQHICPLRAKWAPRAKTKDILCESIANRYGTTMSSAHRAHNVPRDLNFSFRGLSFSFRGAANSRAKSEAGPRAKTGNALGEKHSKPLLNEDILSTRGPQRSARLVLFI